MDGETIITWNATNWATVVLMVVLGFVVIGAASQAVRAIRAKNAG